LNISPWNSLSRLIPVDPLDDSNRLDLDMIMERFSCLRSLRTIESEMIESHAFWAGADQFPFGRDPRVLFSWARKAHIYFWDEW
jgi:hypothetical protein